MATKAELEVQVKELEQQLSIAKANEEKLIAGINGLERDLENQKRHASMLRKQVRNLEERGSAGSKAVQH